MSDADEIEKVMSFMSRYPWLARAVTGSQSSFERVAEPSDADMLFISRVVDLPVQVEGRLAPDGVWRVSRYHLSILPERQAAAEAVIAKEAGDEMFVVVDGLGEAMVRDAIPKILANLPQGEERASFTRRLAQSRFAAGVTLH